MTRPIRAGNVVIGVIVLCTAAVTLRHAQFADLDEALDFAGRACAIIGLVLLLLAEALSARIPGFDRHFGGLTRLWRTHHVLGAGSLLMLMAHPILLALAASGGNADAAVAWLFPPLSDLGLWAGWLALVLMMLFLAPSFRFVGRPDYRRWKILHRLSGPAVLLALAHSSQYGRTLSAPMQTALWVVLGMLAVAALVWHFGLSRRFGRRRYEVARVIMVANNLVELVLRPIGRRRLEYRAGQFVYLTPYDESLAAGHGEEHPYTLSSSPLEQNLRIAIKDLGDASRAIQAVRPGSRVTVEGPFGDFFPDHAPDRQLWIAGGIGVTPFLGRARHLARLQKPVDIHLIYCVQDEARARFIDELRQIESELPGFRLTLHLFYRHGPLSAEFLAKHCPDLANRAGFVCGPPALNRLARRLLTGAGIARGNLYAEEFELI